MRSHGLDTYPAPRGQAPWRSGLVPITGTGQRQYWYLAALVVVLDAAILGPLIGRGSLQLLDFGDYPVGAHPPFSPSAFGFPPGITSRAPVDAAFYWLYQAAPWPPLHLLPLAAVAPLACLGFARIFPGQGVAIGAATCALHGEPLRVRAHGKWPGLRGDGLLTPAYPAVPGLPTALVAGCNGGSGRASSSRSTSLCRSTTSSSLASCSWSWCRAISACVSREWSGLPQEPPPVLSRSACTG